MGLFKQILVGVKATHQANLCHLDIKLDNILVAQDYSMRLADYGLAISLDEPMSGLKAGSNGYMAPEVLNKMSEFDGEKADVFSLGILLFIMAFGAPPIVEANTIKCVLWKKLYESP